ncbi:MAG: hypothetical protein A2W99_09460 [Bacteroidetes bacterium GWF2_33_16]|nr:MAG: hypothetical protein A2X00_06370 [Bacteroidetes bacterium GWE2_32_14]OFY07224.1 MAG: hypothetical protein A2W99_09460 [Bacteroidetes bacterium GWF2_33_16]
MSWPLKIIQLGEPNSIYFVLFKINPIKPNKMKKLIFTLLLAVIFNFGYSQIQELFNYQGVIRNSSGDLVRNTNVIIKVSLLQGSATGSLKYSEGHTTTTTNFGQFSVNIGAGTLLSGSFSSIDWSTEMYLKTEIAYPADGAFTDMGSVQLLTVPYALYAKNVGNKDDADADPANEIQILTISNDTIYLSNGGFIKLPIDQVNDADANPTNELQNLMLIGDTLRISNGNQVVFPYDSSKWATNGNKLYFNTGNVGIGTSDPTSKLEVKSSGTGALFQVINANNDTVFAVYPDGVKVFVDPSAKGSVGGFAVSGRTPTKAGAKVDYFRVTYDSTRIYINDTLSSKGSVGGFAVSGRTPTKGNNKDYLFINGDSTRVYINDSISSASKGSVGGFAVSGRTPTKLSSTNDYFNISGSSVVETVGSEPRILWYPKKEAFLTGRILIESPDSVGTNSMATGFESKSIGDYSQALGYAARAKGKNSTAIGNRANAIGNESYAFGNYSVAQDSGSYAIGTAALAKGLRSFAIGSTGVDSMGVATSATKATGNYSYAFGMGSVATKKGAFAIGTQDTTAGDYSLTLGYQCKSFNWAGTAIGYKSSVTANGATALGFESVAGSIYSTAIGFRATTSNGWFAVALGERTTATGTTAVSIGRSNTASGNISTAIGYNNTSSGPGATSLGANNESTADYSMALGYNTNATGAYSISLGNSSTSSALNTITIGNGSIATFNDAIAIGYQDTASGNVALATGRWTKASGVASFSANDQTKASGQGAFSIGYATLASGFASLAAGSQSTSSGSYSFATGYKTVATTFGTATFGMETTAQSYLSMVIGRYNIIAGNNSNWLVSDPIFVIGNGSSTAARANAFTILKNGKVAIGHDAPIEMLDVNGNARIRAIASGIYLGPVNRTADGTLTTATSDIRLKENVTTLSNGLNKVLQLRGVNFNWKSDENTTTKIGFIAQEVQKVLPELVFVNPTDGYFGVNYAEMTAVLVEAVKEQQNQIEKLNILNQQLLERITKLENK